MTGLFDQSQRKELRPHQAKAIDLLRHSLGKGNRRVVVQMATGGGKTLTAAKIIEGARGKGNRVIFTVPALSLIGQTVEAFEAEGIGGIGVMQADHPRTDPYAPVQVASVQTLARREIPSASVIIVDECHIRSSVIDRLMDERDDVVFIGLSATPWAKGMGKKWQDLVIAATTAELIEAGFLCPFRVFAAAHPDLTGVKTVAGDYHEGQLAERMSEGALCADVVTTWLEKGEDRPTLLFAVNRAHAAELHARFIAAGVASAYVDMNTDRVERAMIERRFRAGEIKVACSVRTLTTGVDWPVACVIDAAPTKSDMLHVQKIGRGLRVNPPWDDCIVLDHSDNTLRLGLVTDILRDRLDDGKARAGSVKKGDPLPKECGFCGFIKPPKTPVCPSCGHEAKPVAGVETVAGELREVSPKKRPVSREEKQIWWSALQSVCLARGRKQGWAAHAFKEKFGVWPRGLSHEPGPVPSEVWRFVQAKDIRYAKRRQAEGAAA